ncbi:D-arabinono-1,4-lactone oxidase [Cellulomonas sp. SLBN-39]|uniref:D-arabinono-1,4-lactone oxidase n=1 Tax=Cellulomonas sp. SLBN-39 TaxID=2768446 RepID=UPI00116C40CE|nr:D-arabinono-1,4-lactone oxidase [Cellulomonas sp. SLBN-39]TQL01678.1 FAD-linked oxidoreductase [Cellulomonas sp. SLBN-39]
MVRPAATTTWENWARTACAAPVRVVRPRDEDEVVAAVLAARRDGLRVRVVGAGHSFTPAAATDGVLLRLDALRAVERVRTRPDGTARVTVGAGVRLRELNATLAARGLAMPNLGDIDHQSLAGAVSTGTHGTGGRLPGLAAQVVGARLVTARGDLVDVDAGTDRGLLELARLGLGTAGVLVALTVEVVPAFRLLATERPARLPAVLESLQEDVDAHDHLEFYWFPHTDRALVKVDDRAPDDVDLPLPRLRRLVDDELLANGAFGLVCAVAGARPSLAPRLNAVAARGLAARRYTARSDRVLVSPRRVRFREAEHAVPREHVADVVREVDAWVRRTGEPVPFPVEVRFAAADDVWLSTAHGRPTAYVAVHQNVRLPHTRYFDAVERIVAEVGGRPHWGKLHGLDAARLAPLYPRFADAVAVRRRVDPDGLFANPYVDRVLGPVA